MSGSTVGRWMVVFTALACVACGAGLPDAPVPPPSFAPVGDPVPPGEDPEGWFDFWPGEWDVRNVQLREDRTWAEVGRARARIATVAAGSAILEAWDGTVDGTHLRGQSLRAWDPALQRWDVRLYWHAGEVGSFYAMEGERDGDALRQYPPDDRTGIRYTFRDLHEGSAVWEEARSKTDGDVWIPTWIMEYTRQGEPVALDASNAPVVSEMPEVEGRVTQLDGLLGAWRGTARALRRDGGWEEGTATARVGLAAGGQGVVMFLDTSWGERTFTALNRDRREDGLVGLRAVGGRPGLSAYSGLLGPGEDGAPATLALRSDARRERWDCDADRCRWIREVAGVEPGAWDPVLEIDLDRLPGTSAWIELPNPRMPLGDVLTGGQPTAEQLDAIARGGYRTVVNLRTPGERGEIADEAARVESLGLDYVAIPVAGADGLTDDTVGALAEVLDDPDAYPVVVHCASGNRVGALLALRARADGASPDEALALGLEGGLTRLEPAVRERLGLAVEPD